MPSRSPLMVFQCPACGKTLVDGTPICQYCGAATGSAPVPAALPTYERSDLDEPTWQEVSYRVMAWVWIATGIAGFVPLFAKLPGSGGYIGSLSPFHLFIGLAILVDRDILIDVAKVLAYLTALGACIGFVSAFGAESAFGLAIRLSYYSFEMAMAGFQIYLFHQLAD